MGVGIGEDCRLLGPTGLVPKNRRAAGLPNLHNDYTSRSK